MKSKQFYRDHYHVQLKRSHLNYFTYGYIMALGVTSVFEFGCNAGRHLTFFQGQGLVARGVDINANAVKAARDAGLEVVCGDEANLRQRSTNAFDVCFTNSVLCHIEEVEPILKELKRIARKYVVCVEAFDTKGQFWYKHQYEGFRRVYTANAGEVERDYTLMVCAV